MSDIRLSKSPSFSFWHTLRLSSFQIGSAMGDILVTSIWNRIMISNFGIPAAPVSFLIALRYLLSPLSLWAGYLSDTKPLWGARRASYIWLGRGLMIFSLPLLGFSLMRFETGENTAVGWALAVASSLLYGVGTLISGSPYLALVRDSAPKERQGLAIGIVQTVLIIFFAISGITFSLWMQTYDLRTFWQMIAATMTLGGFFWLFSILGAEKRADRRATAVSKDSSPAFTVVLRQIWRDPRARGFFFFLSLATFSAWMQDAVLEPFGAEAFHLPMSQTTRLNSYWQTATVITLIISAARWRKRPPDKQKPIAAGGLLIMAAGMGLLAAAAFTGQPALLPFTLFLFGAGFGIYTFGGVSLMAAMASDREAGAYLGLWSISILLSKGLGTFFGGVLRDLLLSTELETAVAYSFIFAVEAMGLITAVAILLRIDIVGFARNVGRAANRVEAQIAGAD